jgi:hypothetical protein
MNIWKINFVEILGDMEYLEYQYAIAETYEDALEIAYRLYINYFGVETEEEDGHITDGYNRTVDLRGIEEFTELSCHTKSGKEVLVPICYDLA